MKTDGLDSEMATGTMANKAMTRCLFHIVWELDPPDQQAVWGQNVESDLEADVIR